jgi:hypothetical protein
MSRDYAPRLPPLTAHQRLGGDKVTHTKSPDPSVPSPDYTKTRHYVYIELFAKVGSALALALLGIAGWQLQARTEESREAADRLERQERSFLPMLRSLSELELTLEDMAGALRDGSRTEEFLVREPEFGSQLRYIAYSVFTPEGDPVVSLKSPDTLQTHDGMDKRISMPLRAAALMYAEILSSGRFRGMPGEAMARLDPDGKTLRFVMPEGDNVGAFFISPDSFPAWKAWLDRGETQLYVMRKLHLLVLIEDLHFAVTETIHKTLRAHPDLGDKYVTIRSEVLRNKPSINSKTPAEAITTLHSSGDG